MSDWIKCEKSLFKKPEVIGIAESLGLDRDTVAAKCLRVWAWADDQTEDGNAKSVTKTFLDDEVGVTGFADAMEKEGWLVVEKGGLRFPNFDRHLGQSAKRRVLTKERVAQHRNAKKRTKALPDKIREDKRREEEKKKAPAAVQWLPEEGRFDVPEAILQEYEDRWPNIQRRGIVQEIKDAGDWYVAKGKVPGVPKSNVTNWLKKAFGEPVDPGPEESRLAADRNILAELEAS